MESGQLIHPTRHHPGGFLHLLLALFNYLSVVIERHDKPLDHGRDAPFCGPKLRAAPFGPHKTWLKLQANINLNLSDSGMKA